MYECRRHDLNPPEHLFTYFCRVEFEAALRKLQNEDRQYAARPLFYTYKRL